MNRSENPNRPNDTHKLFHFVVTQYTLTMADPTEETAPVASENDTDVSNTIVSGALCP